MTDAAPATRKPAAAALARAFPARVDGHFYATPALAQRLDLLRHLVEFSDLLLLLCGPAGAGKSALLAELLKAPGDRWRVCEVAAPARGDADAMLELLLAGLGAGGGGERMRRLERHLEKQHQHGLLSLIAVDDAHLLGEDALRLLTGLSTRLEAVRPRLLLAGEAWALAPYAGEGSATAPVTHLLELPELAAPERFAYVQARLRAAGLPESLLPEARLRDLLADTPGLPGAINAALREGGAALLAGSPPAAPRPVAGGPRLRRHWRPALLVFGAALGLTLLWLPDAPQPDAPIEDAPPPPVITAPAASGPPPLVLPEVEPPAATREPPPPVAETPDSAVLALSMPPLPVLEPLPEEVARRAAEPPLPEEPPSSQPATEVDAEGGAGGSPAPQADAAMAPEPQPRVSSAVAPEPAPAPAPQPAPEPAPAPQPAPEPAPAPASVVSAPPPATLAWLRAQPSGSFTVQLSASQDGAAARRFVARHGLTASAVVLRTRRAGGDWYVVVTGSYPSREAARAAIARMPEGLRRDSPWLRPIAELLDIAVE